MDREKYILILVRDVLNYWFGKTKDEWYLAPIQYINERLKYKKWDNPKKEKK